MVEKPMALHYKEAEELVRLAKKNNMILMVGHILLYHPAVSNLKEMTEAVHVAAVIRGGSSLVHGVQMRNTAEKLSM